VFSGSVRQGDDPMEPVSDILYPVVNRFDKIQILSDEDIDSKNSENKGSEINNQVVAIFSASFYWRDVLKNVLPDGKKGLVVVIENPCTAPFTYLVE
jgi:hypothetical protein